MSSIRPNLMVGVPSAYLSPRRPFPDNPQYNVAVGVEIAPGFGISLDGKALLVGADGHQGRTEILDHPAGGKGSILDTVVTRQQDLTIVDGEFNWRDYSLKGSRDGFTATGESPDVSFSVSQTPEGLRVESHKTARAWNVKATDSGYSIESDFAMGEKFQVTKEGNKTIIDSSFDDHDMALVASNDGSVFIDGKYPVQDFHWTPNSQGFELKGHHPQQHFHVILS